MEESELKDRVRRRLAALNNRSPITAAKIGGLERSYIRNWLEGKKQSIKTANYSKIAKGLDWTVPKLLGQEEAEELVPTFAGVVPEIDVKAGAAYSGGFSQEGTTIEGGQTVSRDLVRAEWGIPASFLRNELHTRPGRVHILPIRGDSMVDVLYDGDRVVIDLDDTDISQGGIFALLDDNSSVIVKQVELIRGSQNRKIRCTSRNPQYQPFELQLDDTVHIIERVACRITRL